MSASRRRWPALLLAAATLLEPAPPTRAHESAEPRLQELSLRLEGDPASVDARLERAQLRQREGDPAGALADLDALPAAASRLPDALYLRGIALLDAGRGAEAARALGALLAAAPDHVPARVARARALVRLARPLEAAADLDVAIAREPVPIPEHYLARADALAAAGDGHLEAALRGLDAGIARMGSVPALVERAIAFELARGEIDAALARGDRAAAQRARREVWLARRGEILERAGRREEARSSYEAALAAIDARGMPRRRSPALGSLEARVRDALARLGAAAPGAGSDS